MDIQFIAKIEMPSSYYLQPDISIKNTKMTDKEKLANEAGLVREDPGCFERECPCCLVAPGKYIILYFVISGIIGMLIAGYRISTQSGLSAGSFERVAAMGGAMLAGFICGSFYTPISIVEALWR